MARWWTLPLWERVLGYLTLGCALWALAWWPLFRAIAPRAAVASCIQVPWDPPRYRPATDTDPWGSPWVQGRDGCAYSTGPNGIDDGEAGDDVIVHGEALHRARVRLWVDRGELSLFSASVAWLLVLRRLRRRREVWAHATWAFAVICPPLGFAFWLTGGASPPWQVSSARPSAWVIPGQALVPTWLSLWGTLLLASFVAAFAWSLRSRQDDDHEPDLDA